MSASKGMKSTVSIAAFTVGLLLILSTGLFTGGWHKYELLYGYTPIIWQIQSDFWSEERLPMTIFKPFGYSETRTVLEMAAFWGWLLFGLFLHWQKYKLCRKPPKQTDESLMCHPLSELPHYKGGRLESSPRSKLSLIIRPCPLSICSMINGHML